MYQIGDLIIYGNNGVHVVEEIGVPDITYIDKNKLYYILLSVYSNTRIYTPIDTSVFMRPVITYEEVQKLISQIPEIQTDIYDNRNIRMLADHYQISMETHDCLDLLQLIKTVYIKRSIVSSQGKILGLTDERYYKRAEELLHGEFAIALGIPKDNVKGYIAESVKKLEVFRSNNNSQASI